MSKKDVNKKKYVDFLQESVSANWVNNLDSYSNPVKDILKWRGKKGEHLDTTLKSNDLEALVDKIAPKKPKAKVLEDHILDSDDEDLLEDLDYGLGYDNMENGDAFDDGLDDLADSNYTYEKDELDGIEKDTDGGSSYDDGLDDIESQDDSDVEEASDPDEDEEEDDDEEDDEEDDEDETEEDEDDVEESSEEDYLDAVNEHIEENYKEILNISRGNSSKETKKKVVTESASPLSMLEEDSENLDSITSLIQEMDSLEDDIDSIVKSDNYNDITEDSDVFNSNDYLINEALKEAEASEYGYDLDEDVEDIQHDIETSLDPNEDEGDDDDFEYEDDDEDEED